MPLLEGLSILSRAHAFGNLRTGVLPDSIRHWTEMNVSLLAFGLRGAQNISADLKRAGTLRQAIADGQLSPEFLGLLADSIGVNQQAIEQRLAERKADGVVGNETNTDTSLPAALADASFAIAPLGPGKREITQAPDPVSVSDPFPSDLQQPSQLRNHFWKNFAGITKGWPEIIQTPEGPIAWSKSKAGNKLRSFKDGEPAHLHYIAAAHLPELLANSRLASVHEEAKGDRTVQEIHRRYAWVDFPNGQRRHILLTVERMSEHADKDKQNADQAYSAEILGVSLEVLPENEGAGVVNLKIGGKTGSPSNQANTPARDNLASFLSGIKPEHRFDPASSSTSAKSHPPLDPAKLTDLIDTDSEASFSIGTDPSSGDSEARINEATVEARKKVAAVNAESIKRAGRFWLSLHGEKGVSQLPELKGKDMRSLVDEAKQTFPNLNFYHWQDGDTDVTRPHDGVGEAEISVADGKVWVDTTRAGGLGSSSPAKWATRAKASMAPAVYQIAQAYAKNNGLKFIPDPAGVSTIATFRRWPQLLSSAIRMGDTSHLDGTKDVEGWKDGDHEHNAGLLALHEYEQVRHLFPEIDGLHLSKDSSTIIDHAGAPVSTSTLEDLLTGDRHPKRLGIGETTLRRAIVTGQVAAEGRLEPGPEVSRRPGGERRIHSGAIEHFTPDSGSGDQGTGALKHALDGISYSIGTDPAGNPAPAGTPPLKDNAKTRRAAKRKKIHDAYFQDEPPDPTKKWSDEYYQEAARRSTRNPESNSVVLGKFRSPDSNAVYTEVAAHFSSSYLKAEDWKELTAGMSAKQKWHLNLAFLRQQYQAKKAFILSHDPDRATGFYLKEIKFLKALGYEFQQEGWYWKATRTAIKADSKSPTQPYDARPDPDKSSQRPPFSLPTKGIPHINGKLPKNHRYAGQMHPAGIWFNQHGFPDFSPVADLTIEVKGLTGDAIIDTRLANEAAGFTRTPDDYTWHHVEDGITMMLVPKVIHSKVGHTGGAAILRNKGFDHEN